MTLVGSSGSPGQGHNAVNFGVTGIDLNLFVKKYAYKIRIGYIVWTISYRQGYYSLQTDEQTVDQTGLKH